MKTIGEETCGTEADSPVTHVLEGSFPQSLGSEIVMKTVGEVEYDAEEDFPFASALDGSRSRSLIPESSVVKPKDEASTDTEDSDEGDGDFTGAPVGPGTGYGSNRVEQEVSDVTDLQVEAGRRHRSMRSPSTSDFDTWGIPARKCMRYGSSRTNESLRNLTVSGDREENKDILPVAQGLRAPFEASRVGRFLNLESATPYRCSNCEFTFTHYEPRIILRSFRGAEPSCPNCGQKSCEKVPQISDQAADVKLACPQCEESFQTNQELAEHLATSSHNPFWCADCERGFKNKNGLRLHKDGAHGRTKKVKCKECGKRCDGKKSLINHLRFHKRYKRNRVKAAKLQKAQTPCKNFYECSECSLSFKCATQFFNHERCHTGERPFACKQCRKRFKHKSNLVRHLLIHGIGQPFQCDVCEKGFTKHYYYVRHVALHKETNPSCSVCGQTFPTSLSLRKHERAEHSGEEVRRCGECGKEFRLVHYFLKHLKTHQQEGTT